MITLLLPIITTLISSIAFAGIIKNKSSGETIELNLNKEQRLVEVISTATHLENKTIELKNTKKNTKEVKLFAGANWIGYEMFEGSAGEGSWLLLPPFIVVPASFVVYDLIIMPIKAPIKIIQASRNKKDFEVLASAINVDNITIEVNTKRFDRIQTLLGATLK